MENILELPEMPKLKIGELTALKPIIQGGMAIKVTTAKLAAAVANCGGVGVIAASGLTQEELREQIREARRLQKNKDGLIAINIMFVATDFLSLVKTAIEEGIDVVIFGAGFSRDIFSLGKETNTPIVPIVSSPKLAALAKKLGAASVILESGEAGGHLGTDEGLEKLIPEVRKAIDAVKSPIEGAFSLITAGGITSGFDMAKMFEIGADSVQLGTRFVLSKECEVHENFKKALLKAKESEIIKILSPVGLKARAILNEFTQKVVNHTVARPTECHNCLKKCSRSFCIMKALHCAQQGDMENGLVFTGVNLPNIKDILSVEEIFKKFEEEYKKAFVK